MWNDYHQPHRLHDLLLLLAEYGERARLVAGGTDLVVELSRSIRPTSTLIDITRVAELRYLHAERGVIRLGALTTHNDVVASPLCVARALPLAQACWEIGAPQLRTRGTVAGNLVTASPANDTITPLIALDAAVVLTSVAGERIVPLTDFYVGVRQTVLRPDELVREIRFPALTDVQRGLFLKLGLRRAQAISVIDVALVLTFADEVVTDARIALGALAPMIVRAAAAEAHLTGKRLAPAVCQEAGRLACAAAQPINDIRGSAAYRLTVLANLVGSGLAQLAAGQEAANWPTRPVLLETPQVDPPLPSTVPFAGIIETTVNDQRHEISNATGKTLLAMLRDDLGLTGTKEGCGEGECGACTVWLNGQAVMSCLAPAPQAHRATVTTIEGLARGEQLHPLQRTFIDHGAVQCGYCIPGMIMAGAKLLDEQNWVNDEQIRIGLSGNICRCTGYRKIIDAVLAARVVS